MDKQTKQDALVEFMNDVRVTFNKIMSKDVQISDYVLYEEYLTMIGIPKDQIDSLYTSCGFNDHSDFHQQRNKPYRHQTGNVSCTISKIEGTTQAVLETLQYELARMNKLCD